MGAETAVQTAIFTAITGLGLTAYDAAPQTADGGNAGAFPYVEVGAIVMAPFDTVGETGFDYVARVHTRSRSKSMREAKDIQSRIYDRLHRGALTVAGFRHVLIQRGVSDVMREADGTFHGVCEYRGVIEKT